MYKTLNNSITHTSWVIAENASSTFEPVFAEVSTVNILCSAPNCLASSSVTSLSPTPRLTWKKRMRSYFFKLLFNLSNKLNTK